MKELLIIITLILIVTCSMKSQDIIWERQFEEFGEQSPSSFTLKSDNGFLIAATNDGYNLFESDYMAINLTSL